MVLCLLYYTMCVAQIEGENQIQRIEKERSGTQGRRGWCVSGARILGIFF